MPDFQIYYESEFPGVFRDRKSVIADNAHEALKVFVASGAPYSKPHEGDRFIVSSVDGRVWYLFKLAAPQGWDVVSA